jgi:NADH-quinone oxidoreductase subunit L
LLLTLGAIVLGFFGANIANGLGLTAQHHSLLLMIPTVGVVILGILIAYLDYGRDNAPRTGFIGKIAPLNTLFTNKWYIDEVYRVTIVAITHALSRILHWTENHILDGNYDRFGLGILRTGAKSTRVQGGWMQLYLGWAIILLAVVALYLGLR